LHALSVFPPKPNSFSEEAALAASQQPVEALDELWDAGLLENWGSERYALHQAVADALRAQGKAWAAQKQRREDTDTSLLTKLFGKQESDDLSATASIKLGRGQDASEIGRRGEMIVSLLKKSDRYIYLRRTIQRDRSKFIGLMFLCLAIIVWGISAAFFSLRTSKPDIPVRIQITAIDDSVTGRGTNQFNYVGSGWQQCQPCGDDNGFLYDNSNSWDNTTGDYVTLTFSGVQIKFYGVLDPKHGIGAISLDGRSEAMIDYYSATRLGDQLMWTSPMLPEGTHTFKLRVTGKKNPSSANTHITVDRVDILSSVEATNVS